MLANNPGASTLTRGPTTHAAVTGSMAVSRMSPGREIGVHSDRSGYMWPRPFRPRLGRCEVHPELRCVWVVAHERAERTGHGSDLDLLQRPVDHPDHPEAKPVFDLDSVQLIWAARTMRDDGALILELAGIGPAIRHGARAR